MPSKPEPHKLGFGPSAAIDSVLIPEVRKIKESLQAQVGMAQLGHLGQHAGKSQKHMHLAWRYLLAAQDEGQVPDLLRGAWTRLL